MFGSVCVYMRVRIFTLNMGTDVEMWIRLSCLGYHWCDEVLVQDRGCMIITVGSNKKY